MGAALFGIGEPLPIDYPFQVSQLANQGLNREVLLADTGYGQARSWSAPCMSRFSTVRWPPGRPEGPDPRA
jgi:hypothetical protein